MHMHYLCFTPAFLLSLCLSLAVSVSLIRITIALFSCFAPASLVLDYCSYGLPTACMPAFATTAAHSSKGARAHECVCACSSRIVFRLFESAILHAAVLVSTCNSHASLKQK